MARAQLAEERSRLLLRIERSARLDAAGNGRRDVVERLGRENAAAVRMRSGLADVADTAQRGLGGIVDESDRLGGQLLPAGNLLSIWAREERAGQLGAVGR